MYSLIYYHCKCGRKYVARYEDLPIYCICGMKIDLGYNQIEENYEMRADLWFTQ